MKALLSSQQSMGELTSVYSVCISMLCLHLYAVFASLLCVCISMVCLHLYAVFASLWCVCILHNGLHIAMGVHIVKCVHR